MIWEFYNTFSDFIKVPHFKIEELYAAISWTATTLSKEDNGQPETLGLLQSILKASVNAFTDDLKAKRDKHEK